MIAAKIGGLGLPQIVRLTKFVIFLLFSGTFFGMVRFCGVRTHEIFGFYKINTGRLNKRFQTACVPCVRLRFVLTKLIVPTFCAGARLAVGVV